MNTTDIIGSSGVSMALIAFFMNLFNYLDKDSRIYILLNFAGASLACYASVLIQYFPFVILEGVWSVFSLIALMKSFK